MKKPMVIMIIVFALTTPALAKITGYVAVDYDTLARDWVWTLSVDKHITDWWLAGTTMATHAPVWGYKHVIPSWAPYRLDYEIYTEVAIGSWSLRLSDWCNHWFAQSGHSGRDDQQGLTLRLKYEF